MSRNLLQVVGKPEENQVNSSRTGGNPRKGLNPLEENNCEGYSTLSEMLSKFSYFSGSIPVRIGKQEGNCI